MPNLTDREAERILLAIQQIRLESRKPIQRQNRIQNLADKVSVIIRKSQRRTK